MNGERETILVAEDDEGIFELVSSVAGDLGLAAIRARNGTEAVSLVGAKSPCLLVLDYGLPDLNGEEVVRAIRDGGGSVPPFIISTGQGDERIAVCMMKLGARDYVIKDSFFLDRITSAIRRTVAESRNERQLERTEHALRSSEALQRGLFDQAPIGIQVFDSEGVLIKVNRAVERMWDVTAESVLGSFNVLRDERSVGLGLAALVEPAFRGGVVTSTEIAVESGVAGYAGPRKVLSVTAFPVREAESAPSVVILMDDITRQKEAEDRIFQLAFFDPLTGLPNRSLMMDRLSQRITLLQRYPQRDILALVNVDRFKIINEARGTHYGDRLLHAIGSRLQSLMREADTVARMNADEFAILLPNGLQSDDRGSIETLTVTERVREALRMPFEIEGEIFSVSASLGITLLPESEGDGAGAALRRADTALHRAKDAGGNQCAFFESGMGESVSERYQTEQELGKAVANKELRLYLQIQVDARGKTVGAESLIRWQHPTRGLLPPGAFVPLAEQSDLIVDLGAWVMNQACRILAESGVTGKDVRLSVNVSPRHFRKANFIPWLKGLLARTGADPTRLTLEITESLFIENLGDVIAKMNDLVTIGVHFSIDDFGTGYSSLAYLKRLPIHELKIDKSFVQDAPTDSNDGALVETILAVAQHMHLRVVAEGVETQAQVDFLNARAEVIHQGYLFGRPEPAENCISKWK